LKEKVDFIIFIAHAGVEDIAFPIKEWRERYKRLCDIGVDVIIGHHPHVPQGYEKYKKSLIFYSLGNFYFDTASFKNKSDDSYSVMMILEKGKNIQFEIIYHKKIDGQTCKVDTDEVNFSLEYLNRLLGDNYEDLNNKTCIELWKKYYYNYYKMALGISLTSLIKGIMKNIFPLNNNEIHNKNLLLLHNIRIDSHRFVAQRALSLISEV